MTVRFGLLGAGRIGKVHARAITGNPDARLVAVADAMPAAAEAIVRQYGAEVRTIDSDRGGRRHRRRGDLHPHRHPRRPDRALRPRGQGDLLREAHRSRRGARPGMPEGGRGDRSEAHGRLQPPLRPAFRAVRKAIDDGAIGTVEMVNITSRDPGAPPVDYIARSGGIFRDMTIHDFDMARWLLGEEPAVVAAFGAVLTDPAIGTAGDFDSVNVLLETASGKQAVISNSRRATYGYDQRIEVLGSGGMVAAENQRAVSIEIATGAGFTRPPLLDFFMTRYTEAYAAEIAAFVAGLSGGASLAPTGQDGLAALVLAEAAVRSVAEGRKVKLSEILG